MLKSLPSVTKALLIANGLVFACQLLLGERVFRPFMLWPLQPIGLVPPLDAEPFLPWQLLTYGFLHDPSGIAHLLFNMLALLMFGAQLEYVWGAKRFSMYYLTCIAGAGICQLAIATWAAYSGNGIYATIGASGGVYGLIIAFGLSFPRQRIALFPLPLFLPARTVAIAFGVAALIYGIIGTRDGVAHFAHLGGMVSGWLVLRYWQGRPPFNGGGRGDRRRFRIVR